MSSVLITNAQLRKSLSAVRSLGARGIKTVVCDETIFTPAGFSRFCTKNMAYPNPRRYPEKFYSWLLDTLRRYKCNVLFPMDDDTLEVVMQNKEELEKECLLPLPSIESYHIACDKTKSVEFVLKAGVSCPRTVYPQSEEDLFKAVAELAFPLVIKPRKSSGSRGIRIVNNKEELMCEYKSVSEAFSQPQVQEYIGNGDRYDVCMIFSKDNEIRASFIQKELRHFPVDTGPSTLQESVLYPELLEMAMKIMSKLKWYGVVEIEFMIDSRDNKPKFMEINPRFWNSLHMATLAGIDFPWMLYKIATEGDVEKAFSYEIGVKCQWLLPGDILHYIFNKNRRKMQPPLFGGKKYKMHDDIISKNDFLPVFGFILACFRYLFDINKWIFLFKR